MKRFLVLTLCAALAAFTATPSAAADAGALKIIATTTQLEDVVRAVGGNKVKVRSLLRAGMDPHDYKLVRSDTAEMLAADLVVAQGLGLEGKMTRAFEKVADSKPGKLLVVADKLPQDRLIVASGTLHSHDEHDGHSHHDHAHDAPSYDPHIWFDPSLWRDVAPIIAAALAEKDAANAAYYSDNAKAWQAKLDADYARLKAEIALIPAQSRLLVTAHEAFAYFARAFDIEVMGIQGVSTENEAGLKHISKLVDIITARRIKAVFAEQSVPARSVQALIEGANRKGHQIVLGGRLYSDTLGVAGSGAETYLGMLNANVKTIVGALK